MTPSLHSNLLVFITMLLAVSTGVQSFSLRNDPRPSSSHHQQSSSLFSTSSTTKGGGDHPLSLPIIIALTREEGKNEKLRQELEERLANYKDCQTSTTAPTIELQELPCIAHANGEDFDQLAPILLQEQWDYVAVTSPEAARVLANVWKEVKNSRTKEMPSVAVVGKATQSTLESLGIPVDFCPSKALAKTLVEELPRKGDVTSVLYPASAKAATTMQDGLTERGFSVKRLNTYDTVTASWTTDEQRISSTVQVACFGSPSAVGGWLQNTNNNKDVLAACIGETSAKACREYEWLEQRIFYPDKPGVEGWAASVQEALETLHVAHASSK